MTVQVAFHTGVAHPLDYACRLLRKAHRQAVRAWVTAPEATLTELDKALWTFEPQEFVPHVTVRSANLSGAQKRAPLWLSTAARTLPGAPDVVVNLGADAPQASAPWARLIEIVPEEGEWLAAARQRWRQYEQWGWAITHHRA